ncbi:hypothetical protein ACHAWX_000723 [Stephanocyclus meneghinianus]
MCDRTQTRCWLSLYPACPTSSSVNRTMEKFPQMLCTVFQSNLRVFLKN